MQIRNKDFLPAALINKRAISFASELSNWGGNYLSSKLMGNQTELQESMPMISLPDNPAIDLVADSGGSPQRSHRIHASHFF